MTFWTHTRPTARVRHICEMCRRVIEPGEAYLRGVGLDGTAWTWKECAHCDALRDVARAQTGDDEYDWQTIADWEPTSWQQMRVKVQWLRGWTRRDGRLYPVPERIMRTDEHGFGWQVDVKAGGPLAPDQPEPTHGPALTRDGFTEALLSLIHI